MWWCGGVVVQASVIIGKGKMGQLLYSLGKGDDLLVGRGEEVRTHHTRL